MPDVMSNLLERYIGEVKNLFGGSLRQVILYGSYARGDYREDSDVDVMILVDLTDMEIKEYQRKLSDLTFDFNMDNDLDIKPIVKNEGHFLKWIQNYPFYSNVKREGVVLFGAAWRLDQPQTLDEIQKQCQGHGAEKGCGDHYTGGQDSLMSHIFGHDVAAYGSGGAEHHKDTHKLLTGEAHIGGDRKKDDRPE